MKYLKYIVCIVLLHISNAAFGAYVGIDLQYMWAKPQEDWKKVFESEHPGFSVYMGGKFNKYIGLELGYNWTTRHTKRLSVSATDTVFGVANDAATTIEGQIRFKNLYLDLKGYYEFEVINKLEGVVYLGVGVVDPHISITSTNSSAVGNVLANIQGKTQLVGRAGLGITKMLSHDLGVRANLGYDSMARLHVRGAPDAVRSTPFGVAMTVGIGGFVTF